MPSDEQGVDLMRVCASDVEFFVPEKGLLRRILARNPNLMLVEHRMDADWKGARHQHPHDQLVYCISGHLGFIAGDEHFEVRAGDSFVVKGGVEHEAWAYEPSVVLDVFSPCREDYV